MMALCNQLHLFRGTSLICFPNCSAKQLQQLWLILYRKVNLFLQELDTEIVVATARGTNSDTTAVAANVVMDERQMNALFLDLVSS